MDVGLMYHGWEWGTAKDGTDTPTFFHAVVQTAFLNTLTHAMRTSFYSGFEGGSHE